MVNFIVIIIASFLAVFVVLSHVTLIYQLQGIAFIIFLSSLLTYIPRFSHSKDARLFRFRSIPLFLVTILMQMIVLATGGFFSPFIFLIHITTLGISFLFRFSLAVLFLLLTFGVILFQEMQEETLVSAFLLDPSKVILIILSFLIIIPIAHILTKHYHLKDAFSKMLSNRVLADESILASLQEIVIVTDFETRILSVNDAAERLLRRSRAGLINQYLFDEVFLKDGNGKLLTHTAIPFSTLKSEAPLVINDLLLVPLSATQRSVTLQVRPLLDVEGKISQFSFVISESLETLELTHQKPAVLFSGAQLKHDALSEEFKKQLFSQAPIMLRGKFILLEKMEQDLSIAKNLSDQKIRAQETSVDIARLARQSMDAANNLAASFQIPLYFSLPGFGMADVAPLVPKGYAVVPEQLTAPFFTVACDLNQVSHLFQKLLDISILLASTEQDPQIQVQVFRQGESAVVVSISGSSPILSDEDQKSLFQPYYKSLGQKTNLQLGSGLEGYICSIISSSLSLPIMTGHALSPSRVTFSLQFAKKASITKSASLK